MISLSVLTGYDLIKNRKYLKVNPYFNSIQFDKELQSYCSNLHAFYITYKNFNDKTAESKVTKEAIQDLKLYYEDIIQNSQRDIEGSYTTFLSIAEKSGDKNKFKKLIEEKNKKLKEIEMENTKN